MDVTPAGECSSKRSLEDLSKDELIVKYRGLLAIAHKAKQAKDTLIDENNRLKATNANIPNLTNDGIIERLTHQKLDCVTALEELKDEKRLLERKFHTTEEKLSIAEDKISELDTLNQSYNRQIIRLTDENEQLITHLDNLEKQIEELKRIGMEQQEQLLTLEKCNAFPSQTLPTQPNKEFLELQEMLSVSLEEVKKLKMDKTNLIENMNDLQSLLSEKENNIHIFGEELITKSEKIEKLQSEINDLNKSSKNNDELRENIVKLQNTLTECENCLSEYKQQVEEKNKELETNTNIADDLTTELHKNRALIEKLKMDIINTSNKLSENQIMSSGVTSDLQNANEKLKSKLKSYHSKIVKFAGDVTFLKESRNELLSSFKMHTEHVHDWKDQLNLLLKNIQAKEHELYIAMKQKDSFCVAMKNLQIENDTLTTNIKSLNKEMQSKVNVIEMLKKDNDELSLCLKNVCEEKLNLENDLKNKNDELVLCLNDLSEEKLKVHNDLKNMTESSNFEVNKLIEELNLEKEKNSNRREEIICLRKEIETFKSTQIAWNESQCELDMLRKQHSEFNERLTNQCEKLSCLKEREVAYETKIEELVANNEDLKNLKEEYEKLVEINQNLKLNVGRHEEQNKDKSLQIENYVLKINDLNNKIKEESEQYMQKYSELSVEHENLTAVVKELNKQINVNKHVIDEQQKYIDKSKSTEWQLAERSGEEIQKLVNENKTLEQIVNKLQEKLQCRENKTVEVQTNIDDSNEFEEKINSLKRENQELLSEMNEMNQALKERGETISKQQAYYEDTLKKMQSCEAQLDKNMDAINKKDNLIRELQQEMSSLKMINKSNNLEIINENILSKKDEEIAQLKNEILELNDKLLNSSQLDSTNYAESENMSTSTISKAEDANRMKDLEGSWEERYSKLRLLALKLKGKIRDLSAELSKEQLEKTESQQKLTKSIQTFQQQIDKLQDELESTKNENKTLIKKLDAIALDTSKDKKQLATNEQLILNLKSELDGLIKDKHNTENWKKQVSTKVQSLKKELEANAVLKKDFENKINKLNAELESKDKALKIEIEKHNETKNILQESNNECKKQSVLNLEMQDYEKSVKELSQKLDKKQELIAKLKTQIDSQKSTVGTLKDKNKLLEDDVKSLENEVDTAKIEINLQVKKLNDIENTLFEKDRKIQELTSKVENARSENEELSTQLSKALANHQKTNNTIKMEKDYLNGKNRGLEHSLREIQATLKLKEDELKEIKDEYDGYKVRAQSVLRQNQNRDVGIEERYSEETASLKAQVEVLTTELSELRLNIQKSTVENDKISNEKDSLVKLLEDYRNEIEENKTTIDGMSLKYQRAIVEHAETVRGLKVHADTLAQCYRQQISELEAKYNREIFELQSKLDKGNFPVELPFLSPLSMTREEGEGSESVDSTNNGTNLVSLEKLLNNNQDQEINFLKKHLTENESKVAHLTALLADTEQDLVKHVQMNKVLKEEIRRHQRSLEREEHAENLEYLKNVIFKFITLSGGDERMRLVPVLNTILKLSPEETQKLNVVARNDNSWSNYIPLWGSSNRPQ